MEKEIREFNEIYKSYCCLDLVRARESGWIDEVVSGLFFSSGQNCKADGTPRVKFCPFCSAKIITIKKDTGWDWKAVANTNS